MLNDFKNDRGNQTELIPELDELIEVTNSHTKNLNDYIRDLL
jgi:hypothetical protein